MHPLPPPTTRPMRSIIDASAVYAAIYARSILTTLDALGLSSKLPAAQRSELEATASKWA